MYLFFDKMVVQSEKKLVIFSYFKKSQDGQQNPKRLGCKEDVKIRQTQAFKWALRLAWVLQKYTILWLSAFNIILLIWENLSTQIVLED